MLSKTKMDIVVFLFIKEFMTEDWRTLKSIEIVAIYLVSITEELKSFKSQNTHLISAQEIGKR